MIKIKVKPLSTNKAWRGKRFKSQEYTNYEKLLMYSLPPKLFVPHGKLFVKYRFGTSSKNADYDNFIKQFQDVISKKYQFNDKMIYRAEIEKIDVEKGNEFIEFEIFNN